MTEDPFQKELRGYEDACSRQPTNAKEIREIIIRLKNEMFERNLRVVIEDFRDRLLWNLKSISEIQDEVFDRNLSESVDLFTDPKK